MKSKFYTYIPASPINKWVRFIWISEGQNDTTKSKVLPNGSIELIINFGNKQKTLERDTLNTKNTFRNYWIAGLQQQPIIIQSETDTNLLGIRFLPGGAYPFFKFPVCEMSDSVIEADWLKQELEDLRDKAYNLNDHKTIISIVEQYLKKKYGDTFYTISAVQNAAINIFSIDQRFSVREFVQRSGYSHKHFISLFRDQVGVTPKTLQRIVRLQKIIKTLKHTEKIDWMDIVYRFSYYDHSHLVHDFKKLTWMSPEEYLTLRTFDENHCIIR